MNIKDLEPFLQKLEEAVSKKVAMSLVNAFRAPSGHVIVEIAAIGKYDRYMIDMNTNEWWVVYG